MYGSLAGAISARTKTPQKWDHPGKFGMPLISLANLQWQLPEGCIAGDIFYILFQDEYNILK